MGLIVVRRITCYVKLQRINSVNQSSNQIIHQRVVPENINVIPYYIPPPWKVIGNSEGKGGRSPNQNTFHGCMDIFWNNTINQSINQSII